MLKQIIKASYKDCVTEYILNITYNLFNNHAHYVFINREYKFTRKDFQKEMKYYIILVIMKLLILNFLLQFFLFKKLRLKIIKYD